MFGMLNKMSFPYRNAIKIDKKFKLDYDTKYDQNFRAVESKPGGFWYQFKNCAEFWERGFFGKCIYDVEINPGRLTYLKKYEENKGIYYNKILVLSTKEDIEKFTNWFKIYHKVWIPTKEAHGREFNKWLDDANHLYKYTKNDYGWEILKEINWIGVSNIWGGIEIKNYYKIRREFLKEINLQKLSKDYEWFYDLDFSSGCVWNLDIIKDVSYFRKITEKEFKKYKVCG